MAEQMKQEATGKAIPAGYQQTEVGVIPEDWSTELLGNLAEKVMVGIASAATHAYCRVGIPLIRNQNIKPNKLDADDLLFINETYESSFKGKRLKAGDLLTARTGYPGTTCIVPPEFENAQSFTTLITRPTNKINSLFLSIFMNSDVGIDFFDKNQIGGGQKNINAATLKNFIVAFPDSKEQTAIANVLSDSDALFDALEQLIAKKQAIKSATMQQLLTGRTRLPAFALRPDGTPKGYKPSELGEIPEDWEAKKMGGVAQIQRGASPRPIDSPVWFDRNSSVGWLRISDVTKTVKYLFDTTQSLSEMGVAHSRFVSSDNLVMSICATVGKPIITKKDLCIHDGFVVFHGLTVNQDYMYYVLKDLEDEWGKQGQTGSQMNLNTDLINGTLIALPREIEEQTAIATILSDMDNELQTLTQKLEKARALKQGMMQQLLTGKIRLPLAAGA
ncbi:restriction endonuclease subunit S [Aeromonas jandaei]